VRFELCYLAKDPNIQCVTLWRDPAYCSKFQGRLDLIDYASQHGIEVGASKEHSYSEDENCMHISFESGELEDPAFPGIGHEYPGQVLKKKTRDVMDTPDKPHDLRITFDMGTPVRVESPSDGADVSGAFALFDYLNDVAGVHGVGSVATRN